MFDFLFKRSARKPAAPQPPTVAPKPEAAQVPAKQVALAAAEALNGAEATAVEFILKCEFADARLKAAEHVVSAPMLEQVLQAMRNADRRVAKLMQARLDALQQQALAQQQAQACVEDALRLAQEPQLMPNQVADLDRAWQAIGMPPASASSAFDGARTALRQRLELQAALQRAIIDVLARLRQTRASADLTAPDDIAQILDALEQEMAQHRGSPEAASLPKHLLPEFAQQHGDLKQMLAGLAERHAAIAARQEALSTWEGSEPASLKESVLKQAWQGLPSLREGEAQAALQTRFDALLQRIQDVRNASRKSKEVVMQEAKQDTRQQFSEALDGMEKALQDGALQIASEHDKALRGIDLKAARLSEADTAALAKARAELTRLQGWARWGGNVSREELLKAAEGLPAQAPAVLELAKKVGSLRERWKSLDVSAGSASRELWERFDAACTTAYAPAAAHFKKLAEERQQNQLKAQAMIAEVAQFALDSHCTEPDAAAVDWKGVAAFCTRTSQAWQRLGTIDRKEKKRLDVEFEQALQVMLDPLTRQREIEIKRREKLIAEANAMNPADRSTPEALRALQERWQEQAKSLPLARKEEQDLWQRFRGACDAVFAKRKEGAVAADADRQQQLQAKETLCATLEGALGMADAAVGKVLREGREAWAAIGPVPRAAEAQIEARYKSASAALQKQLDAAKQAAAVAQFNALRDKLLLCQTVEAAIAGKQIPDAAGCAAWQADWQALPALSNAFERVMQRRFDSANTALQGDADQYAALLEQNRAPLAQELLHLEIMLGIDSPPELSRERLKLQVEVLQSSLKAGQKPVAQEAQMLRLFGWAALVDAQTAQRIDRLIAGFKAAP